MVRSCSGTNTTRFQVFHRFAQPKGQGTIPRSIRVCDPSGFVEEPIPQAISTIGSVFADRLTEKLQPVWEPADVEV